MAKKLVVILGPTAVGKSDLSIEIAKYFDAPIVSSDSRQFYKQMRIGTAVPSQKQLNEVQHYFIHNKDITEEFAAGKFENEALELLNKLYETHDYVILTGGSGLYIDALCSGFDNIPDVPKSVRDNLLAILDSKGVEELQNMLKEVDPIFYDKVDLSNPQRVIRALEVSIATGKPYSSFRMGEAKQRGFDIIKVGLDIDRELLYKRINMRVDMMMEDGLLDEVRSLIQYRNLNSLQTVGYREFFDYFDGAISLDEAIELVKRNSRRYAKRQLTWFRRCDKTKWFTPDQFKDIIDYLI